MDAHEETSYYRDPIMSTARFALWTLAWLVTLAVARLGPEVVWDPQQVAVSWTAVAVNLVIGIGWIVAFARFLQAQDELQRKIMQDALTVTLGIAWVGGFAYVVADAAGLVADGVSIAVIPALLGIVYVIAVAAGMFRYR